MMIVVDIGATKTALAQASAKNNKIKLSKSALYLGAKFKSFDDILKKYSVDQKTKLKGRLCIGVAGAVIDNSCKVTNLTWTINGKDLTKKYGFEQVTLLNDLEASAYGIDSISSDAMTTINSGKKGAKGNRVLISPGTGLGEAIIHKVEGRYIPIASEGGHSDFAPIDGTTKRMWEYLKRVNGNVSFENFLSGKGIGNIFGFLLDEGGVNADKKLIQDLKDDPGAAVTNRALDGSDKLAVAAIKIFFDILAAEAGNLALKCLAIGGVYIGGGITPRLIDLLDKSRFVEIFSNKGKHQKLLKTIPINLITDTKLPLYGAAAYLMASDH